jgi:hypothetical protein
MLTKKLRFNLIIRNLFVTFVLSINDKEIFVS